MSYTFSQFLTLGSATVKVTTTDKGEQEWLCTGCRDSSLQPMPEHMIRTQANEHAAKCRSMPLPTA